MVKEGWEGIKTFLFRHTDISHFPTEVEASIKEHGFRLELLGIVIEYSFFFVFFFF